MAKWKKCKPCEGETQMKWKRDSDERQPMQPAQPTQQTPTTTQVEVEKPAIERSKLILPPTWDRNSAVRMKTHYDSVRLTSGAVWARGDYDLFSLAQKDRQTVANGSDSYVKDRFDTTYTEKSRLSNTSFIAEAVSVDIGALTGALGTYATSGDFITRLTNPAATALHSVANLLMAFQNFVIVQVKVNGDLVLEERVGDLPDPYGGSGFAGSGSATDFNSYAQNGFGAARALPQPFTMTPNDTIEAIFRVSHDFTITQPCALFLKLHGRELDSIPRSMLVSQ
jgi:hypothetical protein